MEITLDEVLDFDDYSTMPKYELQQRAIYGDKKAEKLYIKLYLNTK